MWIKTDAPNTCYVDISKLDTIYVTYVGSGNYKVSGSIGDRDICIKSGIGTGKQANDFVDDLVKQSMS